MCRNFVISVYLFKSGQAHTLITSAFSHNQLGTSLLTCWISIFSGGILKEFLAWIFTQVVLAGGIGGSVFFLVHQFYLCSLPEVGRVFGPGFLLKLYLAGGIGGSVFFLVLQFYLCSLPENLPLSRLLKSFDIRHPFIFPALGAGGAVTATILLDIFLHPTAKLYFIIPVPSMLLRVFILGQDFLRVNSGYVLISGFTHLGGATVATIVWVSARLWKRPRLV